jgi:hypothetical protein
MRTGQKWRCFYRLPGRTDYISHTFLLGSLVITAIKIHETLNHFEIPFKFTSTFLHRRLPLMHGIRFVTAPKLYITP